MNKNIFSISTLVCIVIMGSISCTRDTKPNKQAKKPFENIDTLIVKHKLELNQSYEVGFYSKSYSYYWLAGKDTLDFEVNAIEYEKDSTLHLNIFHKRPILFETALKKVNECIPSIKEDFYISKLTSFNFRDPIYYFDLTKELSAEYEKQFGRKNVGYEKLNQFLLNSQVNKELENFVNTLGKKVKRYVIEKFHLMDKKYFADYLLNVDLTEYPEFAVNGMGLYVELEDKQK